MKRLSEMTRDPSAQFVFDWAGTRVIYALCEPNGAPRYVGKSVWPHQRFGNHLSRARRQRHTPRVTDWVRELLDAGQRPQLRFLEVVPEADALKAERRWIDELRRDGRKLLNSSKTLRRLALADTP